MLLTWLWTVSALMPSSSAISVAVSPAARARRISVSRGVSRSSACSPAVCARTAELLQHGGEVAFGHHDLAGGRAAHDVHQLVDGARLGHVPARARREGVRDHLGGLDGREQHDLGVGHDRSDPARRLDPVDPRHVEIHQHDVGRLAEHAHRLVGIACRPHQVDVRLAPEQQLERFGEDRVVVDHEDACEI